MNIYISNLSYAVNDGDLKDLFGEYGEISSAKVITDRETGRSRGFGFVEMADDAQGQKAIDELNQAEYDGKVIIDFETNFTTRDRKTSVSLKFMVSKSGGV